MLVDGLIKLAMIAAAIGAVVWAFMHFVYDPIHEGGVKQQFDVDLPVLQECHALGTDDPEVCAKSIDATIKDRDNYKAAKAVQDATITVLRGGLLSCSDSILAAAKRGKDLTDAADKTAALERAKAAAAKGKLDQLAAVATGPQQPAGTCDATLQILRGYTDDALLNGL